MLGMSDSGMNLSGSYPGGPRSTPTRHGDRVSHDPADLHPVIDEALICHVGYVVDGLPVVIPMIHARVGRTLYLHSSTGSRLSRLAGSERDGWPVCLTVTLVDGLVLARSQFSHSMNYRSVVVHGRARLVDDPQEKVAALAAIVEHVVPGRSADSRPGSARELAATAVLRVPIEDAALKARVGGVDEEPGEDLTLPYWAGVIPVGTSYGRPEPSGDLGESVPVPGYVTDYTRPLP